MKFIFFLSVVLSSNALIGQSKQDSFLFSRYFDIELMQKHLWQSRGIIIDPIIQRMYRLDENRLYDNPFRHSAVYGDIKARYEYKNRYFAEFHGVFEHRGMSNGVFDKKSIVVYPRFLFGFRDTLTIVKEKIGMSLNYGDLQQFKLNQGLRIYNLDVQGYEAKVKWNDLYLGLSGIGDLSFGNSLNLIELRSYWLGYRKGIGSQIFDSRLSLSVDGERKGKKVRFFNLSHMYSVGNSKIYFEISNRGNVNLYKDNLGLLVGSQYKISIKNIKILSETELRYYGEKFNKGYNTPWPRKISQFKSSRRYLYPLRNDRYPFSKWAVFTDYGVREIWSASSQIDFSYEFYKKWKLNSKTELVSILRDNISGRNIFTYFFYTNYVYYEPIKSFMIGLVVSNKVMNLERPYQTFFMGKFPQFGLSIQKRFLN